MALMASREDNAKILEGQEAGTAMESAEERLIGDSSMPRSADEFARTRRITPMVRQYLELKKAHPDCVLFYRLGDFYECFFEDALTASKLLEITLTGRGKGRDRFPMAGIPHHAARSYIGRLVEAGHRVALCEQTEDASAAKGLVRREVVRIITPGMVVDDEMLDPRSEHLVCALAPRRPGEGWGLALLEISTGSFRVSFLPNDDVLADEVARVRPKEIVLPETVDEARSQYLTAVLPGIAITTREPGLFEHRRCKERLTHHFGVSTLAGFGVSDGPEGEIVVSAAGAVLSYASEANREAAVHVDRLEVYEPGKHLIVDTASRANLEVLETLHGGRRAGSLLGHVDRTVTAMGGRRLRSWLMRPLTDIGLIRRRQGSVAHLASKPSLAEDLHCALRQIVDIERIVGRLAFSQGTPRDMRGLQRSLAMVPVLKGLLSQVSPSPLENSPIGDSNKGNCPEAAAALEGCSKTEDGNASAPELLLELGRKLDPLSDLATLLDRALVDDPPATAREGGLIRRGYDPDLDELIHLATHGKDYLLRLEADEKSRTGVSSLKIRHNRVFGYYIEVTKANLHLVPDDYVRKQTTANAERFITPQLQEWERKILTAEEKRRALELRIFEEIRLRLLEDAGPLRAVADRIADIDCLLSLAKVAADLDWCCPHVDESRDLIIEDGRHPVVEAALRSEGGETYVPSDVTLESDKFLMIVTGPNMAGKSTVLRMAALVVLLAQSGSFVPARKARVGVCDRIFTRVGASDDLAGGRSTFMVEMTETAAILNQATRRSLVVLDEIGRGTSTFDGLSIAWSVAEDLHDRLGCKTMFATHYHELTDLAKERDGVVNYTVAVREWNERVVFLRRLVEGAANRSYGIQVARLAGLPRAVLDRASEVLANLESAELDEVGRPALARGGGNKGDAPGQLSLFAQRSSARHDEVESLLSGVEPDTLSPREALDLLYRLKALIDEDRKQSS